MTRLFALLVCTGCLMAGGPETRAVTAKMTPGVMSPAPDPEVLALRETAWRAWFSGDETTLKPMLPSEFIGLSWGGGAWADAEKTLTSSRAFKASGGRLIRLDFPETRAQRYGDVVILYSRFEIVVADGGKEALTRGRATEVFVRQDGRWVHPGWHLDAIE